MRRPLARIGLACAMLGVVATPAHAVVGGAPTTTPGYMAFVVSAGAADTYAACGGTAISRNVVLTAAHCVVDESTGAFVHPSKIFTLLGQRDPVAALDAAAELNPVVTYITPRDYRRLDNGGATYDVALLQVRDPVATTVPVVPPNRPDLLAGGRSAAVLGWGLTNGAVHTSLPATLQRGSLTLGGDCAQRLDSFDPFVMVCGSGAGPSSPCQGDSGGPLLVSDPATSTVYEAGVVSFVEQGCPAPGGPPVFANLGGPLLGGFVTRYAAQLQRAADSSGATARPASRAPIEPAATAARSVGGGFTLARAIERMRSRVRQTTGRPGVFSHYGCARATSTTFACRPAWRNAVYAYSGQMTISAGAAAFRGQRATRACHRSRAFSACARDYRFNR